MSISKKLRLTSRPMNKTTRPLIPWSLLLINYLLPLLFLLLARVATAQPHLITLEDVVHMAKSQSIAAKQAATQKKTAFWKYRSFLADFRPQLSLAGSLPNFTRSYTQVTQPD